MNEDKVMVKYRIDIVMKELFKEKIDWISTHYDKEVNGFITGIIEDGKIIMEDLLIPIQESGSSSAEVTGANQVKLRKEYKDECKKIIGEWHSHHSLGCFWSGDDEKVINDFAQPRETTIFIVSSKGRHLVRVEMRNPFKFSIDNLSYEVEAKDSKIGKLMTKEIEKKVTIPMGFQGIKVIDMRNKNQNIPYADDEKTIRKDVNAKVRYYQKRKMVEVVDLNDYQKMALENDFPDLDPICFSEKDELFRLQFVFKNKYEAVNKMKNIKDNLVDIMLQEQETEEVEKDEDIFDSGRFANNKPDTYSGIEDYNRRNYLG